MIERIAVGAALWGALQLSVLDAATEQGKAVLEQAERVANLETETRCAQVMAFGVEDLRRAGLAINCGRDEK